MTGDQDDSHVSFCCSNLWRIPQFSAFQESVTTPRTPGKRMRERPNHMMDGNHVTPCASERCSALQCEVVQDPSEKRAGKGEKKILCYCSPATFIGKMEKETKGRGGKIGNKIVIFLSANGSMWKLTEELCLLTNSQPPFLARTEPGHLQSPLPPGQQCLLGTLLCPSPAHAMISRWIFLPSFPLKLFTFILTSLLPQQEQQAAIHSRQVSRNSP